MNSVHSICNNHVLPPPSCSTSHIHLYIFPSISLMHLTLNHMYIKIPPVLLCRIYKALSLVRYMRMSSKTLYQHNTLTINQHSFSPTYPSNKRAHRSSPRVQIPTQPADPHTTTLNYIILHPHCLNAFNPYINRLARPPEAYAIGFIGGCGLASNWVYF
jgi:hypothetical protein